MRSRATRPAIRRSRKLDSSGASAPSLKSLEQTKVPECLLYDRDLVFRARILTGRCVGRGEAERLFAMRNPGTLGHKAVVARDPFLDLLIRGALTGRLLLG